MAREGSRCCVHISKAQLIFTNLLSWVAGLALIAVAIFILVSDEIQKSLKHLDFAFPEDVMSILAYILLALGGMIFIVGLCGCCGALQESTILLWFYCAFLLVIILAEIGAGIYVGVQNQNLKTDGGKELLKLVLNYTERVNGTVDFLQVNFDCCGSDVFTEYLESKFFEEQQHQAIKKYVPETCCDGAGSDHLSYNPYNYTACVLEAAPDSPVLPQRRRNLQAKGCLGAVVDFISNNVAIIVGVALGVVFIEILEIVCAIAFCRHVAEEEEYEANLAGIERYRQREMGSRASNVEMDCQRN